MRAGCALRGGFVSLAFAIVSFSQGVTSSCTATILWSELLSCAPCHTPAATTPPEVASCLLTSTWSMAVAAGA